MLAVALGVVCGLQKKALMKSLNPLFPSSAAIMKPIMVTSPTAFIKMVAIIASPSTCVGMKNGSRNLK